MSRVCVFLRMWEGYTKKPKVLCCCMEIARNIANGDVKDMLKNTVLFYHTSNVCQVYAH